MVVKVKRERMILRRPGELQFLHRYCSSSSSRDEIFFFDEF